MAVKKKRRRRIGGPLARRWFAVGALLLVGLLYYRPLHDFIDARSQRAVRVAAVRQLEREHKALERRLRRASSPTVLMQEARALGYIRPGEHLFIVKDIPQWRRGQHGTRHAASRGH
ncbi:MAG TPA: septum formation initiator family protein [Gaiellaceae bacterium]|nr:septum formation initiator family protein [Gaiellaceae bacterium]